MSSARIATSILLRTSQIPRSSRIGLRWRTKMYIPLRLTPNTIAIPASRFYSQEISSKIYEFSEVKAMAEKPSPSRILIDSREPGELRSTGTIPGSINIPVTSQPDSFFITQEEFEDRYGFNRPSQDQEVIFYCRSGVRSRAAAELARRAGWKNVSEYTGSWLDWEKNGGDIKRAE